MTVLFLFTSLIGYAQCTCTGNIVVNPSFENGTTGWNWSGGTFTAGSGAVFCGIKSGDFQITNTAANWVSQTIGTDLTPGTKINASVYAGTHNNTFYHQVSVDFFDANWNFLSSVAVEVNKVLANTPAGPQLYSWTATVPVGAKYTNIALSGTGDWIKTDQWCVTLTPPSGGGSIGDRVWLDADGDGIQDASETGGITGVTVQLKNSAGTVIATTTTNATGNYLFSGLAAGNYTVVFPTSISGAIVTPQNVGSDDNVDSDASQTTGATGVIALAAGQNITNVDAGYCPTTLQIGNRVWNDANNNGIDNGETGIGSVTVNLYKDDNNDNIADGAAIATTTTNATGNYTFSNLAPGNYIVGVATPTGFTSSAVNGGDPDNNTDLDDNGQVVSGEETRGLAITLVAGTEPNADVNNTYDFGFYGTATGSIGDRVWLDADGDGIQDASETGGITGVTVQLKNSAGTVIATTTTNATGNYLFSGLAAGNYTVVFPTSISGAIVTPQNVGSDDNVDSDASQTTGATGVIALAAGQNITNVDAGYCPITLELGNRVWYDANNDGLNSGENGIPGVTVNLYKDDNNDNSADGASIASTVTDANGYYFFSNLGPGHYIVGVVTPAGYMSSAVNGGDPDNNINLDDNGQVIVGNEIRGLAITLVAGTEPLVDGNTNSNSNITYDFGLLPDCSCTNSAGNQLLNASFENGTTGWNWSGGTLTTGTGYIACGAANGFNNWTSGTSKVWQDVAVAAGSDIVFSAFAGVHAPGLTCSPKLSLIFLNASNAVIAQNDVAVTRDVAVYFGQLEQYTITATAPVGTVKVRVQSTITCNTMKLDAFCLTVTPPTNSSIGDRVWNDVDGDGVQDANEVGLAGVTLTLLNAAGQPIATTTTDAFGNYKFSGLPAGNYSVRVTTPANYSLSAKTQGGDTNLDSDFDPITYTTATITLAANQNRTDIDAGLKFTQPSTTSIGDRVWLDLNADGVQDAGEPGVSNVLVTLYNSVGAPVRSTYTNVNGNYLFTDVAPGTYSVGVSLPPAFVFSPNNGLISGAANSDIIPATGRTTTFTVNAGDQITYVDAGLKPQQSVNGTIGDYVWNDLNKNGIQDAGEPGIAGVTVRLVNAGSNAIIATTTTDATGKYIFNDVPAGDYKIEFVTASGYTITTKLNSNVAASGTDSDVDPVTLRTATLTLAAAQRITTVDAGYWLTTPPGTGKIGDRVWLDANQNAVQDAGETNVQGVTVILYDAANTAIKMTVTNANGNYLFTDLAAGSYSVGFSNIPTGYSFTTQGGGTAATGSDANPATGRTATITLAAGQTNLDVDAGIRSTMAGTASIGNRVWNDLNNNGLQDAGEPGLQGVIVELLDGNGNPIDSDPLTAGIQPATRVTNALGEYQFTGLPAGDYRVRFGNLPAGFNAATKGAGTDRNVDSDGNPIAGGTSTTDVIGVGSGEERLDIDFGLNNPTAPTGQLGDYVWFDSNNNGIQDAGEQGVAGVTVSLLNAANAVVATTVTDANGNYRFVNIADGSYSVKFSNLPAGFVFSPKDLGGNDNTDSDADAVTGTTGTYTITAGNSNLTADAGIYSTRAALGDYVWFDANSNGTQIATEKGIAGITVTLYDAANVAVTSAITDQNGRYFFSNLNPGTYSVGFSNVPGQLVFTAKDAVAAGDAADSDVEPSTGRTGAYTLAAGQVNTTVDAGLKPVVPATIGDFVWYDDNGNGTQDPGEGGVAGVIVTLYNAANQPIGSAITDGNGAYVINNVPAGNGYYVVFSNKPDPSASWTLQNVGGAAAINNSKADATGRTTPLNVAAGQLVNNIDAGYIQRIPIVLSGHVFYDDNGMTDGLVNGTTTIPSGINAVLYDPISNQVIAVQPVPGYGQPGAGTFSFNIFNNSNYRVMITTANPAIGAVPPATSVLPASFRSTGEIIGTGAGNDGTVDGKSISIFTTNLNVTNVNFAIKRVMLIVVD
ncbi:MAG: carboxypeptidase regulatory-like domain-containing protein [Chitinophagaceae bacterium]|nr:carboxypeptidase regulatory-like domain-containing protein [Chitinophagaceae bacterium]